MRFFKLGHHQSERKCCWIVRLPQRPGFLSFRPSSTNPDNSFIPHAAANPPGIAQTPREESWVGFVGMLTFPIPESAKFLTLVLGQSIYRTVLGWAAQLLPHSAGWFVFLPFLFFEYRCCCLYFGCWYIIDQSIEHAQITPELRFYGREKLTVVRRWLVSIFISRHLGCFHRHHLKMLPVPIYLRNNLCLKLIISQLLIFFFPLMFLSEAVFLHSG